MKKNTPGAAASRGRAALRGISATLILSMFLLMAACGGQPSTTAATDGQTTTGSGDASISGTTLKIYNWGDYMEPDVLRMFEQETGVKVVYDEFDTNEDMYLKIKNSGGASYDLCIPSDYMIKKMLDEDMLAELDFSNIPNFDGVADQFKNPPFDPENKYSVPFMWGTVCIAYNPDVIEEPVDSWGVFWDERYKKQMFMINSERDSIGVALKYLGYSLNTKNIDELNQAGELLKQQKPLLITYTVDDVKYKMASGEGHLAVMWSCDVGFVRADNPNIKFVLPKEGTNIWYDSAVVLKDAPNKPAAEAFLNFLCRPDIAALNADYLENASPVQAVIDELPEEIRNDPVYFPDEEMWAKSEVFENLSEMAEEYERIWSDVQAW